MIDINEQRRLALDGKCLEEAHAAIAKTAGE